MFNATQFFCIISPGDHCCAGMFPERLVAPLIPASTRAGLQVHQGSVVAALGNQSRGLSMEKCDDEFIGRVVFAQIADRPIKRNQAIPGL